MSLPSRDGPPSTHRIVSYNDRRLQSLRHLERMLRLRTSELTLVPDDVEETFRRIALRQTSKPRTNLPPHPSAQSGQPILRRGPQRLTRDAMTALGPIPLLQPQQAIFSSVDDDYLQHAYNQVTPSSEHTDSERPISPIREREPAPLRVDSIQSPASPVQTRPSPESSPRPSVHLPFRFGRGRRSSTTQSQPDTVVSVSRTPTRPPLGHARLGSTGAGSVGDTSHTSTLSPSGGSTESTSGLRGGGGRVRDVRDAPHAPSPLHHMQRLSSSATQEPSGDPTKSPTTPHQDQATLFLEGYWHHTPERTKYRIRESTEHRFRKEPPQSEPRRVSDRQDSVMRSLSSGCAPSSIPGQTRLPAGNLFNDVFTTLPSAEPRHAASSTASRGEDYDSTSSDIFHTFGGSIQPDQTSSRPRHFSSDASGVSARFSYYGSLPPSREASSSDPPLEHDLSRLQLDGAASNEGHRLSASAVPFVGSGYSTRPNSSGSSVLSLPDNVGSGPHGVSPLPLMPYTRNQGDPTLPNYTTNTPDYIVDATTAAMQGRESPLDPFSEHYRRQLQAAQGRQVLPANPYASQSRAGGFQARRPSHGHGSRPNHPPRLPNVPRSMDSQTQHPLLHNSQRPFERPAINEPSAHGYGRGGRGEQRSGANLPEVPSFSHNHVTRHSRVQAHRVAYERLHNSRTAMQVEPEIQPSRHSMPQPTMPYNRTNQPHFTGFRNEERSSSPFITHQQRRLSQGQSIHPLSPGAPPARQAFYQQHNSEVPRRAPTRAYRPVPGARYLNPSRDSPLTALALDQGSGTSSRRSHSPLIRATTTARTHRRIPPEQRDQENDGDRSLMRREEEGIYARYGEEEQQRGMMNETPPRIGRVERRMLGREDGVGDV